MQVNNFLDNSHPAAFPETVLRHGALVWYGRKGKVSAWKPEENHRKSFILGIIIGCGSGFGARSPALTGFARQERPVIFPRSTMPSTNIAVTNRMNGMQDSAALRPLHLKRLAQRWSVVFFQLMARAC